MSIFSRKARYTPAWAALIAARNDPVDAYAVEASYLLAEDGPERELVIRLCREIHRLRYSPAANCEPSTSNPHAAIGTTVERSRRPKN